MNAPAELCEEDRVQCQHGRHVAKVLLADTDLASRLALKSILIAAGYAVHSAATAAEAVGKLDCGEYQLVLADLRGESPEAGSRLLAYARQKDYRPATALIASDLSETRADCENIDNGRVAQDTHSRLVRMSQENLSYLLDRAADLISQRADRRSRMLMREAS